jgi:hypothetical protein
MTQQLRHVLTIEYKSIFDDKPMSVSEYLKGLNKKDLIKACCLLIAKQNQGLGYNEIIGMFFSAGNSEFKEEVLKRCAILQTKVGEIGLLMPLTLYRLCEMTLESDNGDKTSFSKEDFEKKVFLAIVAQNQENSLWEDKAATSCEALTDLKVPAMLFSQSFPSYELLNYSINELIFTQLIRTVYLFEFLSGEDERIKSILHEFCQYYGYSSWKEYLKSHLELILPIVKKVKQAHTEISVPKDENFESSCSFLDKLAIQDNESISDYDYVKLRTTPLYKMDDGKYLIISDLFLVETLFKGVFFKLSEINNINKEQGKPHFSNFRSYYCDYFSEQHIVYSILEDIYHNYKHFGGKKIKELTGMEAEPDYYIRNGKYFYLFESKDILINKTIKGSYDFGKYEPELKKRLHKAVTQLIKNICRVMDKEFTFDQNYNKERIMVYPIILLHDRCYDTPGLNKIINQWFKEELDKLDGKYNIENVSRITIINIDTLLLLQNQLKNRSLSLNYLIKEYHRKTTFIEKTYKDEEHAMQSLKNTLLPFSIFAQGVITRKQIHPKLKELGPILFSV